MSKFKSIAYLLLGITGCYAMLAIFIKFLADTTVSVNQALDVATNLTRYDGLSGFILSVPWLLYFAPAIIGIVWLIVILKRQSV